jgi:hypothetical protein
MVQKHESKYQDRLLDINQLYSSLQEVEKVPQGLTHNRVAVVVVLEMGVLTGLPELQVLLSSLVDSVVLLVLTMEIRVRMDLSMDRGMVAVVVPQDMMKPRPNSKLVAIHLVSEDKHY